MENKNKKEVKKERQDKKESTKKIVGIILWIIAAVVIGGVVIWVVTLPKIPQSEIISSTGIHWHPHISIKIKGENVEIPAGIGIGAVHNPMHTHEPDGVVHMEYGGVVRERDTRIGNFFNVWGKDFSSKGIMGNVNGEGGTLKMLVNGVENTEFENYQMKDNDNIEIIFE
jgi:hypothetical protein